MPSEIIFKENAPVFRIPPVYVPLQITMKLAVHLHGILLAILFVLEDVDSSMRSLCGLFMEIFMCFEVDFDLSSDFDHLPTW